MNGFERRKQQKVERIFRAAFRLFGQFGFQKASVAEIAQQANVSPATIYNNFGTKEQQYMGSLTFWMDEQLEHYEQVLASSMSFADKTMELLLLEARNVRTLANEFVKAPASELALLEHMMESYSDSRIAPLFRKYVELGKCAGYIRPHWSDAHIMKYFNMYKNELARLLEERDRDESGLVETFIEMFFYGLVGDAPHC